VLHPDAAAVQVLAVKVLDRVLGVPAVLELGEPEALLDGDGADPAVALEELLEVPDDGDISLWLYPAPQVYHRPPQARRRVYHPQCCPGAS